MGDEAVTPVIGTIMILGITVMGIAAVMLWGGPALQRVQEQGAQAAMLGEFQEVRRDSLVLSITDASRVPRINLESGTFGMREGTRIQITANTVSGCDLHVYDWGGATGEVLSLRIQGCGSTTFSAFKVTGSNVVATGTSMVLADGFHTVNVAGQDLTKGDWLFTLDTGNDCATTAATCIAEAWLMSTLAVFWELQGASSVGLHLEGGGLFSSRDGTHFLEAQPPLEEEAAGNDRDFVIEWHTYSGDEQSFTGRSTPSLFLGLVGNNLRVSEDAVDSLRFDFEGLYAEAWCNTLLSRNSRLDALNGYTEDTAFPCDGNGVQSVTYRRSGDTIQFEFIHARITTSL